MLEEKPDCFDITGNRSRMERREACLILRIHLRSTLHKDARASTNERVPFKPFS